MKIINESEMAYENWLEHRAAYSDEVVVLASYLGVDLDEAEGCMDTGDYMCITDEDADSEAHDKIMESLWAFRPSYLASTTGLDIEVFEAMANNNKCEDNNDAIASLIKNTCGLDAFVYEAISFDGRGHFLAPYDHNEVHTLMLAVEKGPEGYVTVEKEFFIYRCN